jgi:hypothetical protein
MAETKNNPQITELTVQQGTPPEVPAWTEDRYHELANLFPTMAPTAFERLKDDIRQHGQRNLVLTYHGKIVDGRCRDRACRELGIPPRTVEWDDKGSLAALVVSLNFHRRHLSPSQRATIAARLQPLFAKEARERMLAGKTPDPNANLLTVWDFGEAGL